MAERDPIRKASTNLTLEIKKKIIEQNEVENKPLRKIAEEYNVCKTTIGNIIKNKEEILNACNNSLNLGRKRTVDTSRHEQLNKMVFNVVTLCRSENIPISGPLLKAKARMIAQQLNIENFAASNGWLERFKKRYNVSFGFSDDGEPPRKTQKFIPSKVEADQEPKESTMFWSTCKSEEFGEYLDESDVIEEDVRLMKSEGSSDFHDLDTALSTMLIACSINFEAIDSPHFKNFVTALNPNYSLPTSVKLKERVISKLQGKEVEDGEY